MTVTPIQEGERSSRAFVHILLPDEELDESIAESGWQAVDHLEANDMRRTAADIQLAVSSAIATSDEGEFGRAIRSLEPSTNPAARSFAAHYMQYLLGCISSMPIAHCIDSGDVAGRFATIRQRVTGNM